VIEIVFVCTGNICRSPMAEGLLRARMEAAGLDVAVSSAGLLFDGRPAEPNAVAALARMDIDISEHLARKITPEILAPADLVLAMEHRHVREVALADSGALSRTFTLPDLVVRAEAAPRHEGEAFAAWVSRLSSGRSTEELVRADPRLEVTDPMGGSKRVFRQNAGRLDELIGRLVTVLMPAIAEQEQTGAAAAPPTPTTTRSS
jgi:protein-tyrosine phosphatase